ncbi:Sb-PDE family phosphodiesterase, partial [Phocaeicola vulgatus]|nr:Sb-PDE family phosphodiesterase [Phocaeicola vulgatus]
KVIILILWWRNFQLEYWRNFQLVSTTNVTDLVLKLKKTAHDTLLVYFRDMTLKPHTRYTVRIGFKQGIKGGDVNFEVTNFIVAPDKGLKYTISL